MACLVCVTEDTEALFGWEKWVKGNISALSVSQGPAESRGRSVFNVNATHGTSAMALLGMQYSLSGATI